MIADENRQKSVETEHRYQELKEQIFKLGSEEREAVHKLKIELADA